MNSSTECRCQRLSAFHMSQPLRERGTQEEMETLESEVTGHITQLCGPTAATEHRGPKCPIVSAPGRHLAEGSE